jgi:hypothetical protein
MLLVSQRYNLAVLHILTAGVKAPTWCHGFLLSSLEGHSIGPLFQCVRPSDMNLWYLANTLKIIGQAKEFKVA